MTVLPRLVLLTDRSQLPPGRDLLATVRECHEAGLQAVVVREHDLDPGARAELVGGLAVLAGLRVVCSRSVPPETIGTAGLHLAAWQPAPTDSSPWGRSCHSPGAVARAAAQGASWVTLSPYAATASKPGHGPPLPGEAYAGQPVPVLALGGIHPGNAAQARARGAWGVAVMGAVMRAPDPAGTVSALLAALGPAR